MCTQMGMWKTDKKGRREKSYNGQWWSRLTAMVQAELLSVPKPERTSQGKE